MTSVTSTRMRAFIGGGAVTALVVTFIFTFALSAQATDTNQPDTWETLPGEVCEDVGYSTEDSVNNPFVLGAAPDGREWSKVIVKVGSTGHSVTDENAVYTSGLFEGATFVHPEKDSISHVIVCSIPTITKVTPTGGTPTYGTCDVEGNLNGFVDTADYTWAFTGPITARTATANPVGDVVLEGQTVFGPYDLSQKSGEECVIEDVPGEGLFNDQCGVGNDTYTVPETPKGANWHYEVNGKVVKAGTYPATGTVKLEAVPNGDEYVFPDGVLTSWSHDFTNKTCPPVLASTGTDIVLEITLMLVLIIAGLELKFGWVRRRMTSVTTPTV